MRFDKFLFSFLEICWSLIVFCKFVRGVIVKGCCWRVGCYLILLSLRVLKYLVEYLLFLEKKVRFVKKLKEFILCKMS